MKITICICNVRVSEWIYNLQLSECQGTPCSKQTLYLKFRWLKRESNSQPLHKQTLNHLAKLANWFSNVVGIYLYSAILKLQISRLFWARSSLIQSSTFVTKGCGTEPREAIYFSNSTLDGSSNAAIHMLYMAVDN